MVLNSLDDLVIFHWFVEQEFNEPDRFAPYPEIVCRCFRIPKHHAPVSAPRSKPAAIWIDRHTIDHTVVTDEGQDLLARKRVPDLDRLIGTDGEQTLAIGTECHTPDLAAVAVQNEMFLPRFGV